VTASRRPFAAYAGHLRGVNYPGLDVVVFSQKVIPPLGQSWRKLNAEIDNISSSAFATRNDDPARVTSAAVIAPAPCPPR